MVRTKLLSYKDHVFINCPFDPEYQALFYPLVFAIHDAGFVARCALETIDSGVTRLSKIIKIISECKFGIHDISRTELSIAGNLPRFNMPYECGLFWGCMHYGKGQRDKRIMVLDCEADRYQASLSDIAGQDIKIHKNDPQTLVDIVRVWLNNNNGTGKIPGGTAIWEHYQQFQKDLPNIAEKLNITPDELYKSGYFADYITIIKEWLTLKRY